jgi:hypothetical protein
MLISKKLIELIPPDSKQLVPAGVHAAPKLEWILRAAGAYGILEVTQHFKLRSSQRGFTTVEALNVLRRGSISGVPEFCAEFSNWKFVVRGEHDAGTTLYVVAGVSGGDKRQTWVPHSVALITGYIR